MPYIAKSLSNFSQKEIRAMFRKSLRPYKGAGLDVLMIPASRDFGRILVVTPRKVGTAPERNRIRRRLKALFYQQKYYDYLFDLCVIIKKPGIDYNSQQLQAILESVFHQQKASRS